MTAAALTLRARAEGLAAGFPPLLIAATRIAAAITQGSHGRRRAGPGEDFWQYRSYAPGDSTQRIDWRKSARASQTYIRENEWAAANSLWLWADAGPGMAYRSHLARETKAARAGLIAMTLAVLAADAGERTGLIGSGLPAGHGRAGLRLLGERLAEGTELPLTQQVPRFSALALIGDFLAPLAEITPRLTALAAQGAAGHVLQVLDPAEETLPWSGRVEFREISGPRRLTLGRTENLREAYRSRLTAHRDELRDLCRRLGWSFACHHTDQPPQAAILALQARISGRDRPR